MKVHKHNPESEDHGIDLAPMLDFVLNLLIFFIITTSFIKEAGVTVVRPDATTAEYRESGNILVAIRENGDIWMDRKPVDIREVRTMIERLHIERPEDTVVIIADKDSKTGVLTKVMDQVKLGGIGDVSIAESFVSWTTRRVRRSIEKMSELPLFARLMITALPSGEKRGANVMPGKSPRTSCWPVSMLNR